MVNLRCLARLEIKNKTKQNSFRDNYKMSQQEMSGCKPYPEGLVEGKVKVSGIIDEKATDTIDSAWGLGAGMFKRFYLLSVAQIRTCFSKRSLPVTYFSITWVLSKIANSRTLARAIDTEFLGVIPCNLHFK